VAILIVDDFEIVDIHADNNQGLTIHPLALSDPLLQHHVEATRIWKLG
jgi:hypothetical protein